MPDIVVRPHTFAVSRLDAALPVPQWAIAGTLVSVTRTHEELSIVCSEEVVPADVTAERGWRCLRVAGELDFALVGILASILQPLAAADIPVFVVSTYVTDYLLVKELHLEQAVESLRQAGHRVNVEVSSSGSTPTRSPEDGRRESG
jgi:uncharacterized protein